MFQELPLDMFQHIFDNLSQQDLLNILLTNKLIYSQIMKYINTTTIRIISSDKMYRGAVNDKLTISLIRNKFPQLEWNYAIIKVCSSDIESLFKK